jgi:folylpolyglutamate synthase/dihydropteroate synthase
VSLSFWANVGSIAGFLATLLTWFWAYRSRRYYLLVGRVPEYIERLRESTERLAVSNNAANRDRSEILRALKRVRESVESIRRNMSWRKRSDFESLTNQIRQIENADSLDPNVIDEVWTEAQALANRADDIVQDRKFTQGS